MVLDVELQDQTAVVQWMINGEPVKADERVEIKNLGGGKHQLVFNRLDMVDEGEVTCTSGALTSTCKLSVRKGESTPIILGPERVDAPISKPIIFEVPFKSKYTRIDQIYYKDL